MAHVPSPRGRSIRLHNYDYSSHGAYFVTLVTQDRIARYRPPPASPPPPNASKWAQWIFMLPTHLGEARRGCSVASERAHTATPTEAFGRPTRGSIPTIIRTYKAAITRQIRRTLQPTSRLWQRNYYEHVIRDEAEWDRLRRYIETNPLNWAEDEENLETH